MRALRQIKKPITFRVNSCSGIIRFRMPDKKRFDMARAQLDALRKNIPSFVDELRVAEYHAMVDALQESSGENLSAFRIPDTEVKPKIQSVVRGSYRRPGHATYTTKKYCDDGYFKRQVEGLWQYIQTLQSSIFDKDAVKNSKDYWSMSDGELEQLAAKFHIPAVTRAGAKLQHWYVDRDRIIEALVGRDRALFPKNDSPSNVVHVEHMHASSIQQGTQGSSATINFKIVESDIRTLVNNVKGAANDVGLSESAKGQLRIDVDTLEIQLSSQHPKPSIVADCLHSVKAIFEHVAGHVLAAPILFQINRILGG